MVVLAICVLSAILSSSKVLADYPPPSEDGHRYYSSRSGSGSSLVGTARASSSFGSVPGWTGTDWGSLNAGGHHGSTRCVEIPSNLSLCRNMEYTKMRLPNLLEHDTLKEVSQQAISWVRLLEVSCHADTQVQYTC
jgi:secreted frizzled-related protein 5